MSLYSNQRPSVLATAVVQPSLLQQVGMAGCAAVTTVTFIHPIDVVKVSHQLVVLLIPEVESSEARLNLFEMRGTIEFMINQKRFNYKRAEEEI
jgi:hypothetical protein